MKNRRFSMFKNDRLRKSDKLRNKYGRDQSPENSSPLGGSRSKTQKMLTILLRKTIKTKIDELSTTISKEMQQDVKANRRHLESYMLKHNQDLDLDNMDVHGINGLLDCLTAAKMNNEGSSNNAFMSNAYY